MGLFDFLNKKTAPTAPTPAPAKTYIFQNTKHFRGFKRGRISGMYGDAPQNVEYFKDKDLSGLEIVFTEVTPDDNPMLTVHLDGKLFGHVWHDTQTYVDITEEKVEDVHLRIEEETVIGQNGAVVRPRPKLFVKLKEA